MSLEATYLSDIATKFETDINNVLVNDSIVVSSFNSELVTNNVYDISFTVLQSQTTQIDNIKLRKSDNTVISDQNLDIPVTENEVRIAYKYTVSEVIS